MNHTGEEAREELKGIAECGFNASCFVTPAEYDICRDLGLMIRGAKSADECSALHGFESDTPCMIGHFRDTDGADVLVIVNASLEKSTRIAPNVDGEILEYSADRGGFAKPILENRRGNTSPIWLTAGMGTALKIAKA